MQSHYPAQFERDMGCTERELRQWLRAAFPTHALSETDAHTCIAIREEPSKGQPVEQGCLRLAWTVLPARQIALIKIPRLQVQFVFEGLDEAARNRFMRRLDLFMQRGGG